MDDQEDPSDTKRELWANVLALMETHYGGENLSRLARETGIGPGSTTRIKERRTSVGIDVLEKIAKAFGVQPWQLLAPRLGSDLYSLGEDRRLVPALNLPVVPLAAPPRPAARGRSGGVGSLGGRSTGGAGSKAGKGKRAA